MTQQEFEQAFAQRKAEYQEQLKALFTQMHELKQQFHAGNAKLEEERRSTIEGDIKGKRKHECYRLNNRLGHMFQEWESTVLDVPHAVSHFDCCYDNVAVFTITIPFIQKESKDNE